MNAETRRRELQVALDAERTAAERNTLGQFATPPALARQIARIALDDVGDEPVRFLEPSMGSGAFYSALLSECPADRIESATGIEVDPRFVEAAGALWADTKLKLTLGDFTALAPPSSPAEGATLVLANPPYVRHHHLGRERKVELQEKTLARLGFKVSGLSGLYVYFLLLAHDWMTDDGVAAWLVPTEWMDVNYGAAVKRYLCSRVQLLRVHRFGAVDVQFGDALVSSSVIFFRKTAPRSGSVCKMSAGELSLPSFQNEVTLEELERASKWSPYFRVNGRHTSVKKRSSVTLSDIVDVKRGIATGNNSFFIRPREEYKSMGIPERFLRPILPSSRYISGEIIDRCDDGYPKLPTQLSLLDCDVPEHVVKADFPNLWEYLESPEGQRTRQGYLASRRRPWYAQEHRALAPVISTYMGRGHGNGRPFRFFWNRSDAIATNVYLLLIPKRELELILLLEPEKAKTIVDFLHNTDPEKLLGHGRVYGGGLHKLEPKELGRLDATELARELGLGSFTNREQIRLDFSIQM